MIVHLLWATVITGLRAGLWLMGLVIGMAVALLPHLGRALAWICGEGYRIYTRHLLEESPSRNALSLAAIALPINWAIGILTLCWGEEVLPGLGICLLSALFWLAQIELIDLRLRHSTQLEDYIQPWHS